MVAGKLGVDDAGMHGRRPHALRLVSPVERPRSACQCLPDIAPPRPCHLPLRGRTALCLKLICLSTCLIGSCYYSLPIAVKHRLSRKWGSFRELARLDDGARPARGYGSWKRRDFKSPREHSRSLPNRLGAPPTWPTGRMSCNAREISSSALVSDAFGEQEGLDKMRWWGPRSLSFRRRSNRSRGVCPDAAWPLLDARRAPDQPFSRLATTAMVRPSPSGRQPRGRKSATIRAQTAPMRKPSHGLTGGSNITFVESWESFPTTMRLDCEAGSPTRISPSASLSVALSATGSPSKISASKRIRSRRPRRPARPSTVTNLERFACL
jgi:hypothetical protein